MLDLIQDWPISDQEKATWHTAASQFRLPYWDWGQKQLYVAKYGIPQICTADTCQIVKPGAHGAKESFENPLTGFTNPKKDSQGKNVPMGDKLLMSRNAIEDNKEDIAETLPVSLEFLLIEDHTDCHSGVNVLELADMGYSIASQNPFRINA